MSSRRGGWWGMPCWNGLSVEQQTRLLNIGNLPLGYEPEGDGCQRGAQVCVETEDDVAPGPRFYCRPCAIEFLMRVDFDHVQPYNEIDPQWKPISATEEEAQAFLTALQDEEPEDAG